MPAAADATSSMVLDHLDAAGLAAAARVHLRLDDPDRATESRGRIGSLAGVEATKPDGTGMP